MPTLDCVTDDPRAVRGSLILVPEWRIAETARGSRRRTRRWRPALVIRCYKDGVVAAHQVMHDDRLVQHEGVVERTRAVRHPGAAAVDVLHALGSVFFSCLGEADAGVALAVAQLLAAPQRPAPRPAPATSVQALAALLRVGDVIRLEDGRMARLVREPLPAGGRVELTLRALGTARHISGVAFHPKQLVSVLRRSA
ncbi:MAG: hypothetical protein ACRYGR_08585 [Janthinobacterium lividum]